MTTSIKPSKKVIPIVSDHSSDKFMSMYEAQSKIYPRNISGIFKNWRWIMIWITQIVFYGTPWLMWNDRQAMLLDVSTHRFYIFGLVLYPQDLIYLVVILIISALALFLFTAVAGRLWCGFSCPQSVYTEIFLWMERKIEGDRAARMRLDSMKFSFKKLHKKFLKHAAWIGFSMVTGFTFLGYFSPIRDLLDNIIQYRLSPWETFWICFYGFATYGNAGFLREQVCKHMCPYARFQSAMFDNDTLIVTYDQERGEPRSGRSRSVDAKKEGLGDCIDCSFCVQVCPVGIDIRNGLQYECISCGLCVDACNSIMDKMQYPRGLIRFSTQNGVEKHWSQHQILKKILRPRVLIYSGLLILLSLGLVLSLTIRPAFKVDVNRDRGVMSRLAPGGMVENVYQIQLTNVTENQQTYRVSVHGLKGMTTTSNTEITVNPASERLVAISLQIADGSIRKGTHPIMFDVESVTSKEHVEQKSSFYMP